MTKAEDREKVEHDYVEHEGFKVDFGNLENVRDNLERMAAKLECSDPSQKKAVNDYLAALQKPGVTPEELIVETKKLGKAFYKDSNDPNSSTIFTMGVTTNGVADHYGCGRNTFEEAANKETLKPAGLPPRP